MEINLFQIIIFLSVYFTKIYSDSIQATNISSTYSPDNEFTSDETDNTDFFTTSEVINSSPHVGSTVVNIATSVSISTGGFTTVSIPTSSSFVTTQQIYQTVNLIYKYNVESASSLKQGNFTDSTILANVQKIVDGSFNRSGFTITVNRVTIQLQAKISTYVMITDNTFTSTRNDCNVNCMKNATLSSINNNTFQLPMVNGTLVSVTVKSIPILVDSTSSTTTTTTPIINYQKGDSSLGTAGRLGIGLGVTIFALVVIFEVVYLYRKYGCNRRLPGRSNYELTSFQGHQRLSFSE